MHFYHVTYLGNLDGIARHGLVPAEEGTFERPELLRRRQLLFFTEEDGIDYWMAEVRRVAIHHPDIPGALSLPVVLRVSVGRDSFGEHDPYSEQSPGQAWMTPSSFAPGDLEVWDGVAWLPVAQADICEMADSAYDEVGADVSEEHLLDAFTFRPET